MNEQFALIVADSVRTISWTGRLREVAVKCLSSDRKKRPLIEEVINELTQSGGEP